jgi:hypothetical protein
VQLAESIGEVRKRCVTSDRQGDAPSE